MDDLERRGLKAMMIGYSVLGIILIIVMFFALWADHKEKQAMKGIVYIEHHMEAVFNLNTAT